MTREIYLLCLLIVSAGCIGFPPETGSASVEVALNGHLSVQSESFYFNGTLSAEAHRTNEIFVFEDASIVLYNEEKRVIDRIQIGTLTTEPGENIQNTTISTDNIPAYVVVESDDFWTKSVDVDTKGWRKTEGSYIQYWISSKYDKFGDRRENRLAEPHSAGDHG